MCIRDREAGVTLEDIDAIGVTYGPGLVGALLVGLAEAKALAFAANKPLVGVHHIEGHICANYIENKDFEPPYMALVVSGGHSHLVYVSDYGKYEILGRTRDDAAGAVSYTHLDVYKRQGLLQLRLQKVRRYHTEPPAFRSQTYPLHIPG